MSKEKINVRLFKFVCDGCQRNAETKGSCPTGWLEFNIMSGPVFAVPYDEALHACSTECAIKAATETIVPFFKGRATR